MNNDFEPAFYRLNEEKPAALEPLTDPLSELTRRRQGLLLIAASVTLLLSYAVVAPGSAEVMGTNLKLQRPDILPALCGFVTAYFLVLYWLGVYADWSVRRVKLWSPYVAFKRFGSVTESGNTGKGNVVHSHISALTSAEHAMENLSGGSARKIQPLEEQLDTLEERLFSNEKFSKEFASAFNKKMKDAAALIRDIQESGFKRMQETSRQSGKTLEPSPGFKPVKITRDEIKEALVRERRITRVRLAVEVLIPSALGIVAVVRTLLLD